MTPIVHYLHYRIIDVSTVKELVKNGYPHDVHAKYEKPEIHRAMYDVQASIDELLYYRKWFFKS